MTIAGENTPAPVRQRRVRIAAVATGLFLVTLAFRGARLGEPDTFVFDEIFYVNDAVDLVLRGAEQTWVGHPPLAKWLIGLPLFVAELSPVTWRLGALVAGALVVVMVFVATRRLTQSLFAAAIAGGFVLTDGIAHFTGRYAILDGFAALFTTAALVVVLRTWHSPMRYRTACLIGGLSGAALACKWSALPSLVLAVLVCGVRAWRGSTLGRGVAVGASAVGAAIGVYLAVFTPWVVGGSDYPNCSVPACYDGPVERLVRLPAMQRTMLETDGSVIRDSPLRTETWRWILADRSMDVSVLDCVEDDREICVPGSTRLEWIEVHGNRVLWPSAIGIAAMLAIWWRRGRRDVAIRQIAVAGAWAFVLAAPWLLVPKSYMYYAAPVVPALAIAAVATAWAAVRPRFARIVLAAAWAIGAALFLVERGAAPWSA